MKMRSRSSAQSSFAAACFAYFILVMAVVVYMAWGRLRGWALPDPVLVLFLLVLAALAAMALAFLMQRRDGGGRKGF